MKPTATLLALAAMSAAAPAAPAQVRPPATAPAADVRGVVMDSTAGGPLGGARVVLWGTGHEDTSDAEGRFRIRDVPPGRYDVVFFHPRLTELGVASGALPVRLDGADVQVDLGVPSHFTLLTVACAGAGGVTAAGRVTDQGSELPLGDVPVSLRWSGAGEAPGERTVRSDATGWYHACGLPAERTVAVEAAFLDRRAPRREVRAPQGAAVRLDLPLARLRPSRVTATVHRAGPEGDPLADAVVSLGVSGGSKRAVTDGNGRVTFDEVLPGLYTLRAEHLAHEPRVDSLHVPSGMVVTVRLEMAPEPIPLPPLRVSVEGFEETLSLMGGIEVTSAEIEAVRARSRDLGDLLHNQHIPGVIVKRGFQGDVCIEFLTGQVRMFKRTCEPVMVILDGVRLSVPGDVFSMSPDVVERLRLFRPVDAGTLFGMGSGSGVLVVTTKARN